MAFLSTSVKVLSIPLIIVSTCYVGLLFLNEYEERQEQQQIDKMVRNAKQNIGETISAISTKINDSVASFIRWLESGETTQEERKKALINEKNKAQQMVFNAVRAGTITDQEATAKLYDINLKFENAYKQSCD